MRPEEIINEKTLDEDGNEEEDPDKCEATTARIARQHSFMEAEKASQASQGGPSTIDLLSLLVDPKDHVQTVENFFDYAFLIKTKHSEFVRPEDGQGYAPGVHTQGPENFVGRENRQLVLSLSMKDVKAMAACLEGQGRECPLHRSVSLLPPPPPSLPLLSLSLFEPNLTLHPPVEQRGRAVRGGRRG